MGATKILIPKKTLYRLYIKKNLTPLSIGKMLGCSFKTIRNRLKEHNIPLKDPAFARTRYKKKDFDLKNEKEKAYMVGIRVGDFNVYKKSIHSYTIVVRCHTTQIEQVNLMRLLFKQYGKVTISFNKGHYHVNCFLNNSFSFLIPKDISSWEWIKNKHEDVIFSFIAGYTDAEGNLIINQNRARFKIDSYDAEILKWVSKWLEKRNIHNKLRIIYRKGERVPGQSPFPKDLWRLNINDMNGLSTFLEKTLPFLRHKNRILQANKSIRNITKRRG